MTSQPGTRVLKADRDAIEAAAGSLLDRGAVQGGHAVLHLSGLLDRRALAPLERTGAALGSFHPLQTVADPRTAPERLKGAWAGIEGDLRARHAGEELADVLCYALAMADALGLDVSQAMHAKMEKNVRKYPVKEYRGRWGAEDSRKPRQD